MLLKKTFLFVFFCILYQNIHSQAFIGRNWQIGIGGDIVRFRDDYVKKIGDKTTLQIPRFNATKRISRSFSADLALSIGTEDNVIIKNDVAYYSFDLSVRYRYIKTIDNLDAYVFATGTLAGVYPKTNELAFGGLGTGATYWISKAVGINAQVYYKMPFSETNKIGPHIQITGGFIFGLNLFGLRRGSSCYYDHLDQ